MQLKHQFKLKQKGFIQNFIIPGIILIGVVIAGIAMLASNSGGTDTSNEKASMLANSVIGQALTVSGAIQRADADGTDLHTANFIGKYSNPSLDTLLVGGKYITALPVLTGDLAKENTDNGNDLGTAIYVSNDTGWNFGGDGKSTDLLIIDIGRDEGYPIATAVCQRINNKLNGTPSQAPIPVLNSNDDLANTSFPLYKKAEGCMLDSGHIKYYKVLRTR